MQVLFPDKLTQDAAREGFFAANNRPQLVPAFQNGALRIKHGEQHVGTVQQIIADRCILFAGMSLGHTHNPFTR